MAPEIASHDFHLVLSSTCLHSATQPLPLVSSAFIFASHHRGIHRWTEASSVRILENTTAAVLPAQVGVSRARCR